jgi:hypothetical protein
VIQSNWDPASEDPPAPKFATPGLGVDWESQQSQMYAEWRSFESRLDDYSKRRYFERGVGLSDAEKYEHRRRFERQMRAIYGSAYADVRWAEEHEEKLRAKRETRDRSRGAP